MRLRTIRWFSGPNNRSFQTAQRCGRRHIGRYGNPIRSIDQPIRSLLYVTLTCILLACLFLWLYQKVAAERGMSPPETRSATKKKKKPTPSQASSETGIGNNNKGGVALFFSPPDQEANARREQAEQIAQDAERCVNIVSSSTAGGIAAKVLNLTVIFPLY